MLAYFKKSLTNLYRAGAVAASYKASGKQRSRYASVTRVKAHKLLLSVEGPGYRHYPVYCVGKDCLDKRRAQCDAPRGSGRTLRSKSAHLVALVAYTKSFHSSRIFSCNNIKNNSDM